MEECDELVGEVEGAKAAAAKAKAGQSAAERKVKDVLVILGFTGARVAGLRARLQQQEQATQAQSDLVKDLEAMQVQAASSREEEKAGMRMAQAKLEGELAQAQARLEYMNNYSKGVARKSASKAVATVMEALGPAGAQLGRAIMLLEEHRDRIKEGAGEAEEAMEGLKERVLAAAAGGGKAAGAADGAGQDRPQTAPVAGGSESSTPGAGAGEAEGSRPASSPPRGRPAAASHSSHRPSSGRPGSGSSSSSKGGGTGAVRGGDRDPEPEEIAADVAARAKQVLGLAGLLPKVLQQLSAAEDERRSAEAAAVSAEAKAKEKEKQEVLAATAVRQQQEEIARLEGIVSALSRHRSKTEVEVEQLKARLEEAQATATVAGDEAARAESEKQKAQERAEKAAAAAAGGASTAGGSVAAGSSVAPGSQAGSVAACSRQTGTVDAEADAESMASGGHVPSGDEQAAARSSAGGDGVGDGDGVGVGDGEATGGDATAAEVARLRARVSELEAQLGLGAGEREGEGEIEG